MKFRLKWGVAALQSYGRDGATRTVLTSKQAWPWGMPCFGSGELVAVFLVPDSEFDVVVESILVVILDFYT